MADDAAPPLRSTPLASVHDALGARMVDFAGWSLPVQYPAGILAEHAACRASAALFDVSHMGQLALRHPDGPIAAAQALEALCPGGLATLAPGGARYTQLTADDGGVIDDLIVSHAGDHLFVVVNASRRGADLERLAEALDARVAVEPLDRALLALQGPKAWAALGRVLGDVPPLRFMQTATARWRGHDLRVSRLGYTGEDGVEISVSPDAAPDLARALLDDPAVTPAGLGARDSLRLEAALPLWGAEMDMTVTPVEAGMGWSIPKRRRAAGDFPGADAILRQLTEGPPRSLVGVRPEGAAPARGGTPVLRAGRQVGRVTSGGFAPTLGAPVALALIDTPAAETGAALELLVRGKARPAILVETPFVPHRYAREATR